MTPVNFPESNTLFGPPSDLEDSQCLTIYAYQANVVGGSVDVSDLVITAWKPSEEELKQLNEGANVYFSSIGGLPPHYLCTNFREATNIR